MKKILIIILAILIIPMALIAGLNFGLIKTAKKRVDKVDEKVGIIKKIEQQQPPVVINRSPVISSVVANPTTVSTGAVSAITCSASDADGDILAYTWSAASGTISGTGHTINWTAPASSSTYVINVTVSDGHGGSKQSSVNVPVTKLNNPPTISSLVANPTTISTGAVSAITCTASDSDGDTLTYTWSAASGTITGTGATVNWTAPLSSGTYTITCSISDGKGGTALQSVDIYAGPPIPHELPDTGQTLSYTSTFGEDNDYQPAASQPSYTDNGNGTTTDNRTGLMWVKDGNSAGCNNGGTLTWDAAITFCEGLTYAGYSDWRLPNRRELMSIVDYGTYNPSISATYFPNTQSKQSIFYWTSTTYVPATIDAWTVTFYDGYVAPDVKTDSVYVRCVRVGP